MKYTFLRHFHSSHDQVTEHGLREMQFAYSILKRKNIVKIVATNHPRVLNSARALAKELSLPITVVHSNEVDCFEELKQSNVLLISQQPILVKLSKMITGNDFLPSMFLTGKVVEVDSQC